MMSINQAKEIAEMIATKPIFEVQAIMKKYSEKEQSLIASQISVVNAERFNKGE